MGGGEGKPPRGGGTGQDHEQGGDDTYQKHPHGGVGGAPGEAAAEGFRTDGQSPHETDRMHARGRFPEKAVEKQRGGQQREKGDVH